MRTNIRLEDDRLEEAKIAAFDAGQTLTSFIEDAVRRQLTIRDDFDISTAGKLPLFSGDGLLPDVDLTSNAALLDLAGAVDIPAGKQGADWDQIRSTVRHRDRHL